MPLSNLNRIMNLLLIASRAWIFYFLKDLTYSLVNQHFLTLIHSLTSLIQMRLRFYYSLLWDHLLRVNGSILPNSLLLILLMRNLLNILNNSLTLLLAFLTIPLRQHRILRYYIALFQPHSLSLNSPVLLTNLGFLGSIEGIFGILTFDLLRISFGLASMIIDILLIEYHSISLNILLVHLLFWYVSDVGNRLLLF